MMASQKRGLIHGYKMLFLFWGMLKKKKENNLRMYLKYIHIHKKTPNKQKTQNGP